MVASFPPATMIAWLLISSDAGRSVPFLYGIRNNREGGQTKPKHHSIVSYNSFPMKRILLTGMSGTGKSTVINRLAELSYKAVDLDCDAFSEWVADTGDSSTHGSPVEPDRDWVWREDRVQGLLTTEDAEVLFLSGCASNMGKFRSQFDQIILLSAPVDVIVERLASRTNNPYGKRSYEVDRVLELIKTVEPLLRRIASYEINASARLDDIVTDVLRFVQSKE
jgi:shikimate kinase